MDYFTFQKDTGGVQVLRKGIRVEHFSEDLIDARTGLPTEKSLRPIQKACEKVEDLELPATASTAVWYYSWFRDCPKGSPLLPLIRYTPSLYQHGFSEEDAQKAREFCCPIYPLVEPDGSCILAFPNGVLVKKTEEGAICEVSLSSPEESVDVHVYSRLAAKDYHIAQCGQKFYLGSCYADYEGLYNWFTRFDLTNPAAVQEVLHVVRQSVTSNV